jgi:hypothetical protein
MRIAELREQKRRAMLTPMQPATATDQGFIADFAERVRDRLRRNGD